MARRTQEFDISIFVNCPFDDAYRPLLRAVIFTIHDCGFIARTALEDTGSGETRLDKILRIIRGSRFSIHDISRTEVSGRARLPRFNMPFECGLAFGILHTEGPERATGRDALLLAANRASGQQSLSDLAGQDAAYHQNQPELAIRAARRFLAAKAKTVLPSGALVRGDVAIQQRYARFEAELPALAAAAQITLKEVLSLDYVAEWTALAAGWQVATPR